MNDSAALQLLSLDGPVDQLEPGALKRAFRAASRKAHPDAGGSEDAFKRVTEAVGYLQGRLNGDIPAMTRAINEQTPSQARRAPMWTRAHVDAADALRFDDILDDLRTVTEIKPLIEFLPAGEVMVSLLPAGAMVSFDVNLGARVFDRDGNELDCNRSIVGDPRSDDDLGGFARGE